MSDWGLEDRWSFEGTGSGVERSAGTSVAERTAISEDRLDEGTRARGDRFGPPLWWEPAANDQSTGAAGEFSSPLAVVTADATAAPARGAVSARKAGGEISPTELPAGERANEQRIRLLAWEFARGSLSLEQRARLDIVTERMRALMPKVRPEDFALIDEAGARRARRMAETQELLDELGID